MPERDGETQRRVEGSELETVTALTEMLLLIAEKSPRFKDGRVNETSLTITDTQDDGTVHERTLSAERGLSEGGVDMSYRFDLLSAEMQSIDKLPDYAVAIGRLFEENDVAPELKLQKTVTYSIDTSDYTIRRQENHVFYNHDNYLTYITMSDAMVSCIDNPAADNQGEDALGDFEEELLNDKGLNFLLKEMSDEFGEVGDEPPAPYDSERVNQFLQEIAAMLNESGLL